MVRADIITGINGTLNRQYLVIAFNSLADAEKWAGKTMADPEYQALLRESLGFSVENSTDDNLFRDVP